MSIRELALAYGNQLCRKFDPGSEHVSSENNNEIQTSYSYAFARTGIGYSIRKSKHCPEKGGNRHVVRIYRQGYLGAYWRYWVS
jgi:hypothetical protein